MTTDDFASLVARNWSQAVAHASHGITAFRAQLLAALSSPDGEVRSAAVAALNEADDRDSRDAVLALIDDPFPAVRHEVFEYLSEFATVDDVNALVDRLDDDHVRFHVTRALCRLTGWSDGLLNGDEPDDVVRDTIDQWRAIARDRVRD
jgi:HEAT repeat protein